MNLLAAFLVEDIEDVNANITLIHNESAWGHAHTRGKPIPMYDSVADFTKHLLSLSSFSLKGFKKMSHRHSSYLLPLNEIRWMYGLLKSLADICGNGDMMYLNKMFEYGVSESSVPLQNGEMRVNGRLLIQRLQYVGSPGSDFKIPRIPRESDGSPYPENFVTIAKMEQQRGIVEGFGYFQGFDLKMDGEKGQWDNFQNADNVERQIFQSAFMTQDELEDSVEWGQPVIPKLLAMQKQDRSDDARFRLAKSLVYVCVDILKVSMALWDVESASQLLGDTYDALTPVELELLRIKFGIFLECAIPAMSYVVVCVTVKNKTLLSEAQIVKVLKKARTSRRVLFKHAREKILGKRVPLPLPNLTISHEMTLEDIRGVVNASMSEDGAGEVTFILREAEEGQQNGMDLTLVDALLQVDEAAEFEVDAEAGAPLEEVAAAADANKLEVPKGENEEGPVERDEVFVQETAGVAQLSFAGGPIFVKELLEANAIGSEADKARRRESLGLSEEGSYSAWELEEDLRRSNESGGIVVTPMMGQLSLSSEGHSSGSEVASSTRIDRNGRQGLRGFAADISPIAQDQDPNETFLGRPVAEAPKEQNSEDKFSDYLAQPSQKPKDDLSEEDKTSLAKYFSSTPSGVKAQIWSFVSDVVADELLNGIFMSQTARFNRAVAAILIARYVCQWARIRKDGETLEQAKFDKLMTLESKRVPQKSTAKTKYSCLKLLKEKVNTVHSPYYIINVLTKLYPANSDEIQAGLAEQFVGLCKN